MSKFELLFVSLGFGLSRKLSEIVDGNQRGFIPGRNFGMNDLELDVAAIITDLRPRAEVREPLLAGFDFGHASPSISQEWIFLTLSCLSLPPPLLSFLKMIYQCVDCIGQVAHADRFLFAMSSGIIQGCPASGAL